MLPELGFSLLRFREELSLRVGALFSALLVSKFFHTVLDERIAYLEANGVAALARAAHARLLALLGLLLFCNGFALSYFAGILLESGPSVLMLFAFE
jgi:hypothetical protein